MVVIVLSALVVQQVVPPALQTLAATEMVSTQMAAVSTPCNGPRHSSRSGSSPVAPSPPPSPLVTLLPLPILARPLETLMAAAAILILTLSITT
jgi:hypothetical protein